VIKIIDISQWAKKLDNEYCVYRYIDMSDGTIKYVGIVCNGTVANRHKAHSKEEWYVDGQYLVEYIVVNNRSEAEAIESHLISLYGTDQYYNKAKTGWGINALLPTEFDWKPVITTIDDLVKDIQSSCNYYDDKYNGKIPTDRIRDYIKEIDYIRQVHEYLENIAV
jgi:hypothetical protein